LINDTSLFDALITGNVCSLPGTRISIYNSHF